MCRSSIDSIVEAVEINVGSEPEQLIQFPAGVLADEIIGTADAFTGDKNLWHRKASAAFDHFLLAQLVSGDVDLRVGELPGLQQ